MPHLGLLSLPTICFMISGLQFPGNHLQRPPPAPGPTDLDKRHKYPAALLCPVDAILISALVFLEVNL